MNKILMSICGGNLFGFSQKERVKIRSGSMRKLSFPVLAASRFYFWLNYNGRRSRLNFESGKAFFFLFFIFPKRFYFQLNYRRERSR